ncbi:MAG: DUF4783 domain-containing protein [Paludibacteraceae bacterium]|nr:DUF4783 domain-containing protein [Paludibacteraceae bacterium]
MNRILLIAVLCMSVTLTAFAQEEVSTRLTSALARGDVRDLSVYFTDQMEVSGIGAPGIYDVRQMSTSLTAFFSENRPRSCRISHQGTRENATFYVLSLLDANDKEYRVYVLLRRDGDRLYIKQFRIDNVRK